MEILGPLRRLVAGPDPRPPSPPPRRRWFRVYGVPLGLLALLGLGLTDAQYWLGPRHLPEPVAVAMEVLILVPVLLTVAGRPLTAWRVAYPMLFVGAIGGLQPFPWSPGQIAAFLLVFAGVAFRAGSGVNAWATALTVVPAFVFMGGDNAWGTIFLLVAIALAGDLVSRRRRAREELAELTAVEQARRAVLEERTRIAREMHDVVAHHMSMIAVQAETAPYRVTGLPEPAEAEFASIATAARSALTDMRRLLGVLRADTDEAPLTPQPGLADVAALVEKAARAGLEVTLAGEVPPGLPEATGLAAYRIVQEALANAARHAPGGPVRVLLRATPEALTVEVRNGPPGNGREQAAVGDAVSGPGHGLAGMRERATLLGGTLETGPQDDGGYRVAAVLPLTTGD
ncbi:sensor histidine kinase [Nucisporomicrobium flavum]|jgi:signal transduction histidine kinase|uniref:sensor histidine kinase n=1 Tax=Nucisporomicrobium flavum TaxID=2785915 RepID=UPI0018F46244|nr:histidine kinase [Nucisporomicrobium flavum]